MTSLGAPAMPQPPTAQRAQLAALLRTTILVAAGSKSLVVAWQPCAALVPACKSLAMHTAPGVRPAPSQPRGRVLGWAACPSISNRHLPLTWPSLYTLHQQQLPPQASPGACTQQGQPVTTAGRPPNHCLLPSAKALAPACFATCPCAEYCTHTNLYPDAPGQRDTTRA
jgi:hypothetical protein